MSSDNPTGAVNQQERPSSTAWLDAVPFDVGHYVAGFVDGEGSFNVPIRRSSDRGLPWRIALSFNVSQLGPTMPHLLREVFGVGTVRGRGDGVFYYEVTRPSDLEERVSPFFERFHYEARRQTISGSFGASFAQSSQDVTCASTGSSRSSQCEDR